MMFDVEAKADLYLTGITFQLYNGINSVNLYTASGGYSDKTSDSSRELIHCTNLVSSLAYDLLTFDIFLEWTLIHSASYETSE